jgi:hypothetical protein
LAVGADGDNTSGAGAAYIFFMNTDGTVSSSIKIASDTNGGPTLTSGDLFGKSVAGIGDLDGDGVLDLAVGANGDDTGATSAGATHVLFMAKNNIYFVSQRVGIGTTSPDYLLTIQQSNTATDTATNLLAIDSMSDGTPAAGLGGGILFRTEANDGSPINTGQIQAILTDVGTSTADSVLTFLTRTAGGSLAERMRIDDAGNIGIGTSSPAYALEIAASSSDGYFAVSGGSGGTADKFIIDENGNVGIGTATPSDLLQLYSNAVSKGIRITTDTGNADPYLKFNIADEAIDYTLGIDDDVNNYFRIMYGDGLSGTAGITIDTSNNIGIGDIGPDFGLELVASTSNGYFAVSSGTGGDGDLFIIDESGNVGIGTTAPVDKLHIYDANDATLSIQLGSSTAGTYGGIQFKISSDTSDGYYKGGILFERDTSNDPRGNLHFLTDNVADTGNIDLSTDVRMTITAAGNVGIGTTTPSALLDVAGEIIGGAVGSEGKITLRTTGSETDPYIDVSAGNIQVQAPTGWVQLTPSNGIKVDGGDQIWWTSNSGNATFDFYSGSADTSLTIKNSGSASYNADLIVDGGRIGIGTTSPAYGLEINASSSDGYFGVSNFNSGDIFVIDESGNVGIGTTSPQGKLHVNISGSEDTETLVLGRVGGRATIKGGPQTNDKYMIIDSNGQYASINHYVSDDVALAYGGGSVGIGTTTPSTKLHVYDAGASVIHTLETDKANGEATVDFLNDARSWRAGISWDDKFKIRDLTAAEDRLTIDTSGNVGIGTIAPSSLLEIYGTSTTEIETLRLTNYAWNENQLNTLGFYHGPKGSYYKQVGAIKSKLYSGGNDGELQFWTLDGNSMGQKMTILDNGNVGIGTTSPAYNLEIAASSSDGYFAISGGTSGVADKFIVDENGNVGIGTNNPTQRLTIANDTANGIYGVLITGSGVEDTNKNWRVAYSSEVTNTSVTTANVLSFLTSGAGAWNIRAVNANHTANTADIVFNFRTAGDAVIFKDSGLVGIGTTSPVRLLSVWGGGGLVCSGADASCPTSDTAGELYATTRAGGTIDVAEWIKVGEKNLDSEGKSTLTAGDLLCVDTQAVNPDAGREYEIGVFAGKAVACQNPHDQKIIGVVSTKPHLTMGAEYRGPDAVRMALTGRTPVKVSLEAGPITPGDLLTSSSQLGVAMKATKAGRVIGIALESFDNPNQIGKIMVLINPHWYGGELNDWGILGSQQAALNSANSLTAAIQQALASIGVFVENGFTKIKNLVVDNLRVGSPEKPAGITIYDEDTGEPYCIKVKSGKMVSVAGECSVAEGTNNQQPITSLQLNSDNDQNSNDDPETIINSYPQKTTTSTQALFEFSSPTANVTFQCKVNLLDWQTCQSPKLYPGLNPGEYTFEVYAVDQQGNYDHTPATYSWTIIGGEPIQSPEGNEMESPAEQEPPVEESIIENATSSKNSSENATSTPLTDSTSPPASSGQVEPALEPPLESSNEDLMEQAEPEPEATSTESIIESQPQSTTTDSNTTSTEAIIETSTETTTSPATSTESS